MDVRFLSVRWLSKSRSHFGRMGKLGPKAETEVERVWKAGRSYASRQHVQDKPRGRWRRETALEAYCRNEQKVLDTIRQEFDRLLDHEPKTRVSYRCLRCGRRGYEKPIRICGRCCGDFGQKYTWSNVELMAIDIERCYKHELSSSPAWLKSVNVPFSKLWRPNYLKPIIKVLNYDEVWTRAYLKLPAKSRTILNCGTVENIHVNPEIPLLWFEDYRYIWSIHEGIWRDKKGSFVINGYRTPQHTWKKPKWVD